MTSDASDLPTIPPPPPKPKPNWLGRITAFLGWIYLLGVIGVLIFIRSEGDRWWPGTVVLLGPRWPILIPLVLSIPLTAFRCRRMLLILGLALLIGLFPIMGFALPWRTVFADPANAPALQVLTCNTHSDSVNPDKLAQLIAGSHCDVVALQECKTNLAQDIFTDDQWHVAIHGEFLLASRFAIQSSKIIPHGDGIRCVIESPAGPITVFCVHLDSPHTALRNALSDTPDGIAELEENISLRRIQAASLAEQARNVIGPMLIAGDCNLTTDSSIYRDNLAGFHDAFESAGFGFGWTYHTLWTITRIDHIMTNGQLVCRDCRVGPDVGSPHKPVIADFSIIPK